MGAGKKHKKKSGPTGGRQAQAGAPDGVVAAYARLLTALGALEMPGAAVEAARAARSAPLVMATPSGAACYLEVACCLPAGSMRRQPSPVEHNASAVAAHTVDCSCCALPRVQAACLLPCCSSCPHRIYAEAINMPALRPSAGQSGAAASGRAADRSATPGNRARGVRCCSRTGAWASAPSLAPCTGRGRAAQLNTVRSH